MAITHPFSAALMTLDWLSQPSVALVSAVTFAECANIRFLGIIYKKRYHGPWICYIFAYLHICIRRRQLFPRHCLKSQMHEAVNLRPPIIIWLMSYAMESKELTRRSSTYLIHGLSFFWYGAIYGSCERQVDNSNIIPMHGTTLKKLHYLACY